jgi:transcriptional regulator with XRE-family HTH domain
MRSRDLKAERLKRGWGQIEAAHRLGVSQPYLAMLEKGRRRLTPNLERKATQAYGLSPVKLPLPDNFSPSKRVAAHLLTAYLSRLGYPGFLYVRPQVQMRNPEEVLLTALAQESLEARVAEALPWLLTRYWQTDFKWLVSESKKFDLQNRLGFMVSLARRLSERGADAERTHTLGQLEATLDRSRLAREDFFPRPPRNDRERQWLTQNRPEEAQHWNLLSDLRPEHLQYVD